MLIHQTDLSKVKKLKTRGDKKIGQCPVCHESGHDKKGEHLAIFNNGDGKFCCIAHPDDKAHQSAIWSYIGVTTPDNASDVTKTTAPKPKQQARIVATYDYTDADGKLLHQTVRKEPKTFLQRRPAENGKYIWSLKDYQTVLYNLPGIASIDDGKPVVIVEGEKDADSLNALGYVATTAPMGAGKWQDSYTDALRGLNVIIVPDNDTQGLQHAVDVSERLEGVASSVRVASLKSYWDKCPEKGDISDYIQASEEPKHDVDALLISATSAEEIQELLADAKDDCTDEDELADELLWSLMQDKQYSAMDTPPHQPPLVGLKEVGVVWRGNVHTLVAQSKAGKTHALGALMRTMVTGERTLGWTIDLPERGVIAYLDFEQDAEDFHKLLCHHAGVTEEQVHGYRLAGMDAHQAQRAAELIMERTPNLCMLIIDGYADLSTDVNSAEEAVSIVQRWMDLTATYNVALLGVLHLNPGSETKSRGHLGSQLERKSKTVLQIDVDENGIRETYVFRARKQPVPKGHGASWEWNNEQGGFVEVLETRSEAKMLDKQHKLKEQLEAVILSFNDESDTWTHTRLKEAVMAEIKIKDRAAINRINTWMASGWLVKTDGDLYKEPANL
jgi:5S rRNA maturation endonuclease (ribonuclease M5)